MLSSPTLADTHCHLTSPDFDSDRDLVLDRARAAGVAHILVPGLDLESSQQAIRLAEADPGIHAAVGIHPHVAKTWDDDSFKTLQKLAQSPQVVAIGEIGLDYYRKYSPQDTQLKAFKAQLELATAEQLPVIIHIRESLEDVLRIVVAWADQTSSKLQGRCGVLHAYSGDEEAAMEAVGVGFYIGIAGPLTYPNADDRRQTTQKLPMDRLLIETDSPYMSPSPKRGQRNEPAFVTYIAERLAQLHDTPLSSVAAQTSSNAAQLFGWNHGNTNGNVL
jgi:TatD DNase family protein